MHKTLKLALAALTLTTLAACGGGGGGAAAPSSSGASPEGAYQGTTSAGSDFTALVLDNGVAWAVYGTRISGTLYVRGVASGVSGTYNGSTYSTPVKDYYYTGQTFDGTLSGSYLPGTSFNGNLSYTSGGSSSFTAAGIPSSSYNYNAAPSLSTASGIWSGTLSNGESGSINVASNGSFTGVIGTCSLTGQLTPRASGKNVFNATITFGSAPCAYPGVTSSGNAVVYPVSGGLTQIIIAGTTPDRSAGVAFLSQR
jgi:hypothetical protein